MMLSVLINTYERPRQLSRCLEALARQKQADPFEVVVVDDGGRIDLSALRRVWGEQLDLQWHRIGHGGRSAARNHGIAAARGERLLLLGDDVIVRPGCLARHRAIEDPLVALVGPYPWESLAGSAPFRRWAEPNPQDDIADPAHAGWLHFATGNLSASRATLERLGGFDERFTCYGWEDLDLGLRLERIGGRVVFDPAARAVHEHPPMTRAQLWRREREMGRSAWLFADKWAAEAPAAVAAMKFWNDPAALAPPPAWRTALGERLIGLAERFAPGSEINRRLYERMIWSQRLAGVAEQWRESQGGGAG